MNRTELPEILPVFPLSGVLLLPRGQLPLNVFEPRYLNLVSDCLGTGRLLGIVQPAEARESGVSASDTAPMRDVGCCGRITSFQEQDNGRFLIGLHGLLRFRQSGEVAMRNGYRRVRPDYAAYLDDLREPEDPELDRDRLVAGLRAYFRRKEMDADWDSINRAPPDMLITTISMVCPFSPDDKQALLECADINHRARLLVGLLETALADETGPPVRH